MLGEVDDEQGEEGFEQNKTLTGVKKLLGWIVSRPETVKSSCCSCFLRILGIMLGFSKTVGGFGSRFDLV